MKKSAKLFTGALSMLLVVFLCACSAGGQPPAGTDAGTDGAHVDITFQYEKQSGYATNQFAVWIEDGAGNLVRTLYATKFTATGGYQNRPDALYRWVEKAGLASMESSAVDAITSATPAAGQLSYTWDLKDVNGNEVPAGDYGFFVEGSLRGRNSVLYSGTITVGDAAVTAEAAATYSFEATADYEALTEEAPETAMIGPVTATFVPAA